MDVRRARRCNTFEYTKGAVLYWMNRDQRVDDNWAFLFAAGLAKKHVAPMVVVFNLDPSFLGGGLRQLQFKIEGLQEVEARLRELNIPFYLTLGKETERDLGDFINGHEIGAVVTDFSPLRLPQQWLTTLKKQLSIPLIEVDAHNIVPAWIASDKLEFAAHTLRPKIRRLLPEFLQEYPAVSRQTVPWNEAVPKIDWGHILNTADTRRDIAPVASFRGGAHHAHNALHSFLEERLSDYHLKRNDPSLRGQSDLSPYLHYGHISAQHIALMVSQAEAPAAAKEAYLEELIVRKELADNFCYFNPEYDSTKGFHIWAKTTLEAHRNDPRIYLYSEEELDDAQTHDPLWNAAQREMRYLGKMHGFMRMYWAKKLLEWTRSPEEALRLGILFNDRYELDGRDPNGYAGLCWSIGGVHDRAWGEREIFGKIRYMNDKGCRRKFSVADYCASVEEAIATLPE